MNLIDAHAHLALMKAPKKAIGEASAAGVRIVESCIDDSTKKALDFEGVFLCIGASPSETSDEFVKGRISCIRENKARIVAVGEVGLDYHWVKDPKLQEKERKNFRKFIELSRELDKPLVIHSRKAEADAIEILRQEGCGRVMMHCFSGNFRQAVECVEQGWLVSVPTNIFWSKQKQDFARKLPLENIVLETDSPFLSPARGQENRPVNVELSARKIAELRDISFEEVAKQTTKNAEQFFRIK